MESVDNYYQAYVEVPCKKLIDRLDEYDKAYENYITHRPDRVSDFIEFIRQRELKLNSISSEEEKKKALKKHFGVDTQFIKGIESRIAELNTLLERIQGERFEISVDLIPAIISRESGQAEQSYMEQIELEFDKVVQEIDKLRESIQRDNAQKNSEYKASIMEGSQIYEELKSKQDFLRQYSDKITDYCAMWGISPLDMDIDNNTFTLEELNTLYDKYIEAMEKSENSQNVVRTLRNKVPNSYAQLGIVGVLFFLCFTPVLNVLALAFFGGISYGQIRNKNKAKYYSVLGAITFKIDPMSMNTSELDPSLLLPEELTDEMLDEDPRFDEFINKLDSISEKEEFDKASEYQQALTEFSMKREVYVKDVKDYNDAWERKRDSIRDDITKEINALTKAKEDAIKDYEKFEERFSKSLVFNSEFTLGRVSDTEEQTINVGLNNVIIRPALDTRTMETFLRCIYVNIITHVNPTNITVHVYDPNNRGALFMPFFSDDVKNVLMFEYDDLTKVIDELRTIADTNLKELQGYTIHEYNERAEKEGLTPKKYHVLYILSQPKNIEEDEALRAFFDYSTDCGIMIYIVSENLTSRQATLFRRPFQAIENPIQSFDDRACREFASRHAQALKDLAPKSGILWEDFMKNVFKPEEFWTKSGNEFIDFYPGYLNGDPTEHPAFPFGNEGDIHMLGVGGTGAGKSVFINHCIATSTWLYSPRELELWLADFKGVEFTFYLGGEKFPAILPHMAACLCTADPDFATSLFKAFRNMADFRYEEMMAVGQKNMPGWNGNVKAMLESEKERGPQDKPIKLVELHRKDAVPYNTKWTIDDYWPRVLFIVDEFQVIFEKADAKNLESINADITQISKVARAAGAHIFFTSQSMKKTVSADILNQFSLRFGLRCAEDTSMDIMGSKLSSSITAKNGWLYVKTVSLKPEEAKFIKTPFIEDKEPKQYRALSLEEAGVDYSKDSYMEAAEKLHASPLHAHIAHCADEAKKRGLIRKYPPIKYSQSEECKFAQLEEAYKDEEIIGKVRKSGIKSGLFFLGDRMAYSANRAPMNIILGAKNNTHIFGVFEDNEDLPQVVRTLMYNIRHNDIEEEIISSRRKVLEDDLAMASSDADKLKIREAMDSLIGQTVLLHSSSMDLGYLCEFDKYVDKRLETYYSEKCTARQVLTFAKDQMEKRKNNPNLKDKPIWIILLAWDKLQGFGVDVDSSLRADFINTLSLCGEFNIHFIFLCTGIGKITESLYSTCNTIIAGRVDSDTSLMLLKSRVAAKTDPKNGWMYIKKEGVLTRVKIYQKRIERELQSNELVL